MPAIYRFDKNLYEIIETERNFTFTPSTERQSYSAHVQGLAHQIHALTAAKDGRKPSQRVLLEKVRQLSTYASQLATHLALHNEHKLMLLLNKKISYLTYLKQRDYSLEDLRKLGRRLVQSPATEIAKDPLLNTLQETFFKEIDGIAATNKAEKKAAKALIPYTRALGKKCVAVTMKTDSKSILLIRNDVANVIRKIRQALPHEKKEYAEKDLVQLAKLLATLPLGYLEGHPFLKAKKELLFAEIEKVDYTEEPIELIALAKELNETFVIVKKQQEDNTGYKLEKLSAHIITALRTFTKDKYDYDVDDIQSLWGLTSRLPPKVFHTEPFAQEMRELLYQEVERTVVFGKPSKEELQVIYKMAKAIKTHDSACKKLDYLIDLASYSPKDLGLQFVEEFDDFVVQKRKLCSNNAANFVSSYMSRNITEKTAAETTLAKAAVGKWILWSEKKTGQGYVTVRTDSGYTHHCLWGANLSEQKSATWAIYNASGALVDRKLIVVTNAILAAE